MNSRITLLGGLLIVQLLIVLLISVNARSPEPIGGLVDLDPAAVTRLTVTDADGTSVTLQKSADRWLMENGARADAEKIASVIERLAGMQSLWPVAATSSSQSRFEVADAGYQRRLEFSGAGVESRIYLGSSPGYRRVHARNGDSDDVFSIEFANHEVPTDVSEWVDQSQLQVQGITKLTLQDGWTLSVAGDEWLIDGAGADADKAQAMVRRVEQLRVLGVYSGDETALETARELNVTAGGEDFTMTLRHDPAADEYVVTSTRTPGTFTLASYIAEQILLGPEELQIAPSATGGDEEPGSSLMESLIEDATTTMPKDSTAGDS
jgi:hypothetical protein